MDLTRPIIEKVFLDPNVAVKIACLTEDPEVILGYSITEGDIIHWVYVKEMWRKQGIAKMLLPKNIKTATNLTNNIFNLNLIFIKGETSESNL